MTKTAHQDLHSEHVARKGEHPGRSRNPVIKVHDIAWLEFEKPDLTRAEAFAREQWRRSLGADAEGVLGPAVVTRVFRCRTRSLR